MSSTYSYPGASLLEEVRFYLGDTETAEGSDVVTNPLVKDVEIIFALDRNDQNAKKAAAFCARYASIKLLHEPQSVRLLDFSASSGSGSAKELSEWYLNLAERLERETARAGIYAGGISVTDKEANRLNTNVVQPAFRRGMHDFDSGEP